MNQLPVKEKSIVKKIRWFYYLIAEYKGRYYVRKRPAKDIWENLYEFILIENKNHQTIDEVLSSKTLLAITGKNKIELLSASGVYKQQLTHQTICGQFICIKLSKPLLSKGFELVDKKEMEQLPFPKFINYYLQDKTVSLNLF